jgi:hypothetical protein
MDPPYYKSDVFDAVFIGFDLRLRRNDAQSAPALIAARRAGFTPDF